ncbi:MAG: ATP-binding cassette domain-containing protein, partial [Bacteroidota bacterium]
MNRLLLEITEGVHYLSLGSSWRLWVPELRIKSGEITALVGPSACGKTTLLRIMLGQKELHEGKLAKAEEIQRPRSIGYVSQENSLIPWRTVASNVGWAADRSSGDEFVERILHMSGLLEHRDKFSDQLSGGLKRRAMLARAFALA